MLQFLSTSDVHSANTRATDSCLHLSKTHMHRNRCCVTRDFYVAQNCFPVHQACKINLILLLSCRTAAQHCVTQSYRWNSSPVLTRQPHASTSDDDCTRAHDGTTGDLLTTWPILWNVQSSHLPRGYILRCTGCITRSNAWTGNQMQLPRACCYYTLCSTPYTL